MAVGALLPVGRRFYSEDRQTGRPYSRCVQGSLDRPPLTVAIGSEPTKTSDRFSVLRTTIRSCPPLFIDQIQKLRRPLAYSPERRRMRQELRRGAPLWPMTALRVAPRCLAARGAQLPGHVAAFPPATPPCVHEQRLSSGRGHCRSRARLPSRPSVTAGQPLPVKGATPAARDLQEHMTR
jgi:hypothetical protein